MQPPGASAPLDPQRAHARLASALAKLDRENRHERENVAALLKGSFGDAAFGLWVNWAYPGADPAATAVHHEWRRAAADSDGVGLLFVMAERVGWIDPEREFEALPPEYSDDGLAAEFTLEHGSNWLYCAGHGGWYFYDGRRYIRDPKRQSFNQMRHTARKAAAAALADPELNEQARIRVATNIASARTTAAIERLAMADPVHAVAADVFDRDPFILNTPGGLVDLRTGETSKHDRRAYATKITGAAAGGECPIWQKFLGRVTGDDADLIAFLQRFVGYCCTGSTQEHALLFLYGLGGNGKTTFLNTIQGVLGDYAMATPMETLMESRGQRHPTDLARLQGARTVISQEMDGVGNLALSLIKQMVGGDTMVARFMRQDFFEYKPQFKLILAGNHKPGLRQVDEAIRRRFYLVPFTHTIPAAERDPQLFERLKGEWPGILAWALAGCLEWQRVGLQPPESVRAATQAYLEDEDIMRTWLTEACEQERAAYAPVAELHRSYQEWAEAAGEPSVSLKRFSQALEDHGYKRERTATSRGFRGLRLRKVHQPRLVG